MWRDLDRAARKVFEEKGLTKWSYSHAKDGSVRHGLGHWVGLSVHDSGPYGKPIPEGAIVTIEPGYYDKDKKWGIRIEDSYIVTKDGYERISAGAPREVGEIEELMKEECDLHGKQEKAAKVTVCGEYSYGG
jgi:Xaa-Pro aminopeptidase